METTEQAPNWVRSLLIITAIYYAACGITAVFTPEVWYLVAGIPSAESHLILNSIGGLMLGMSYGAWLGTKDPRRNWVILATFLWANIFDFLIVLAAIIHGALPVANGAGFLVADALLIAFFAKAVRVCR